MIGIKCDGCNKMHQTDLLTHRYADSIPDDWFTLYKGGPDSVEKTSHFCSLECLNRWLTPQLTKDAEVPVYEDTVSNISDHYPWNTLKEGD